MNYITIIDGGRASGKSLKAKEIVGNRKAVYLTKNDMDSTFKFQNVSIDTEFIVFDDLNLKECIKIIKWFLNNDKIIVNAKNKPIFTMEKPNIIIIKQSVV